MTPRPRRRRGKGGTGRGPRAKEKIAPVAGPAGHSAKRSSRSGQARRFALFLFLFGPFKGPLPPLQRQGRP
jgi:hypothetical protein